MIRFGLHKSKLTTRQCLYQRRLSKSGFSNESSKRVYLLELTCVWDSSTSFQAAMDRKMDRYERLGLDIEEKGYHVYNWPFEVGGEVLSE